MPILVITTTRQSTQAFKAQAVETVTQALYHTVSELLADIHADGSKRDSRMRWQWMAMVVDNLNLNTKSLDDTAAAEVQRATHSHATQLSHDAETTTSFWHYNVLYSLRP